MTFYQFLVFVHIFSAILGMGPGFFMTFIVSKASSMTELRYAYTLRNRLHLFVMVGGTVLLISGIGMGLLNPVLFRTGWYIVSLLLFLIALAFGPLVLSPRSKPIKKLLADHQEEEEIPQVYNDLAKELFFYERIENMIFLLIIALMITKPF